MFIKGTASEKNNEMIILQFVKEDDKWYIDFPEYPFSKSNLEMVAGADDLLEHFANGEDRVVLEVEYGKYKSQFNNYAYERVKYGYGADYKRLNNEPIDTFWLCPVTLLVLGKYPKYLYIKKLK
jgi:hypothetical protein